MKWFNNISIKNKIGLLTSVTFILGSVSGYVITKFLFENIETDIAGISGVVFVLLIVLLAVSLLSSIIVSKVIVQPIREITNRACVMAEGDLSQGIEFEQKDEVGQLADAFRKIQSSLKSKAEAAREIANGSIEVDIEASSEADVLGQAILEMRDSLAHKAKYADRITAGDMDIELKLVSDQDVLGGAMLSLADCLRNKNEEIRTANQALESNSHVAQVVCEEFDRAAALIEQGNSRERASILNSDSSFKQLVDAFNHAVDNILKPVDEAAAMLQEMATGDLTVTVDGDCGDRFANIKSAISCTLDLFNGHLGKASDSIEQIANRIGRVSDSSQSLSQAANGQAISLMTITSSLGAIGSQTKQSAENASKLKQLADANQENAVQGNIQMKKMSDAMDKINSSSNKISKIIKVIDEIAFQTNLLALNAAIEAATAGVHGKGFAVVAEEVRSLAQRSAKAAKETSELIHDTVKKVEDGSTIAGATVTSLREIADRATNVTELIDEIACASNEQSESIELVSANLSQIDQFTQSNITNALESDSASSELADEVQKLKQTLSTFKLKEQELLNYETDQPTCDDVTDIVGVTDIDDVIDIDDKPDIEEDNDWLLDIEEDNDWLLD